MELQLHFLRLEVIGIWFTGVATILAVLVALFAQIFTEKLRRPRLQVEHDNNHMVDKRYLPPARAKTPNCPEREELWIRLRIKNLSNVPAINVQIRFIGTLREGESIREQRPSWWFKVSNLNAVSLTIPPKFTQYFDIAYVKNEVGPSEASFYLAIVRGDSTSWQDEKARIEEYEGNKLEVGFMYDISFAVVSNNADARFYSMKTKVLPRRSEEPLAQLLGENLLNNRVVVVSVKEITSKQAFSATIV